jgi:anti-sigma factor RsiW
VAHINDFYLETRSVDEWQSADERNSREKVSRARQAAEDLFKAARPNSDAEPTRPVPNGGAPREQETRRQPRIFTVPPRLPPNARVEPPVAAQPIRQRAPGKQPTRTVPPSQIGRVRALATYGMTPVQVAELYGVNVTEIDRILKSPVYGEKRR